MRTLVFVALLISISGCRPTDNETKDEKGLTKIEHQSTDAKKTECISSLANLTFEFLPDLTIPDHLFTIVFTCLDDNLKGKIFGPDPEGEHGLWFFRADLGELSIDSSDSISFNFMEGDLYPERITINNYLDELSTDDTGYSRARISFKGQIMGDSIVFRCISHGDCYSETMTFKKKN